MKSYEDFALIWIISLILSLVILYFLISAATKANKQVELQRIQVRLLKLIAQKLNATDEEIKDVLSKL